MEDQKKRHGCLTAWLFLIVVVDVLMIFVYIFLTDAVRQTLPGAPNWIFPILISLLAFDLICILAIFRWKKWGFWGACVVTFSAAIINCIIGMGINIIFEGLLGIVILFAVLQIGKKNGWSQLE